MSTRAKRRKCKYRTGGTFETCGMQGRPSRTVDKSSYHALTGVLSDTPVNSYLFDLAFAYHADGSINLGGAYAYRGVASFAVPVRSRCASDVSRSGCQRFANKRRARHRAKSGKSRSRGS